MSYVEREMGYEQLDTRTKHGQVYMATHKGEQKLPFMNRSFISFSFGGKDIENFGLIATIDSDRMERRGSAEFNDLVDEYNIIDGQFYWGTHYKANKVTFNLATDGITQQELEDFKSWFAGGKTRELILAEHPNRAILARAETPSEMHLLPFEEPTIVKINGSEYHTSTTKYKGEITLSFVMDMPFWYSKINIFGHYNETTHEYDDTWYDPVQQREINVLEATDNIDVMKIVLEDNIPISSMITISLLLGNNTYAHLNETEQGHIADQLDSFVYLFLDHDEEEQLQLSMIEGVIDRRTSSVYLYSGDTVNVPNTTAVVGEEVDLTKLGLIITAINQGFEKLESATRISEENTCAEVIAAAQQAFSTITENEEPDADNLPQYEYNKDTNDYVRICADNGSFISAKIAGPHMAENTGVETLAKNSAVQFYYAGTAPAYPTLIFTLTPKFNSSTNYIESPCNSYATTSYTEGGDPIPYNTITIESLDKKEFRFTTPNIYTAYNETVKLFTSLADREGESWEVIRTLIRDNVKHYAIRDWACRIIDEFGANTVVVAGNDQTALNKLKLFFTSANNTILTSTYEINSETGKAIGKFSYRKYDNAGQGTMPYTIITNAEEDVGDMIRSKYLIITDRNHPNEEGRIVGRTTESNYTKTYSHVLMHNVENGLEHLYIKYKNMYL